MIAELKEWWLAFRILLACNHVRAFLRSQGDYTEYTDEAIVEGFLRLAAEKKRRDAE